MAFDNSSNQNGRVFNNADNFAMAFDMAWKALKPEDGKEIPNKEKKLKMVLEQINDHPFYIEFPSKAKDIAQFRIRLLDLN